MICSSLAPGPSSATASRYRVRRSGPISQALGRQLDVAGTADHGPDVGLVRRLVAAEPDVPVWPEDLRLAEFGGQFLGQFGHREQDFVLVDGLVLGPVGL